MARQAIHKFRHFYDVNKAINGIAAVSISTLPNSVGLWNDKTFISSIIKLKLL